MFCPNCGAEVRETDNYCFNCGQKLDFKKKDMKLVINFCSGGGWLKGGCRLG